MPTTSSKTNFSTSQKSHHHGNADDRSQAPLDWPNIDYLFSFGDSYTTTGYNVTLGINSVDPGFTSANGPNWIQNLRTTYSVNPNLKGYNLAYGGATVDAKFVTPYLPTVLSLKDQVDLFKQYFAQPPAEAPWTPDNTLFAIWIGINDVGNSYAWTNVSLADFYKTEHEEIVDLFTDLAPCFNTSRPNFLVLTVPPISRAPLFEGQGSEVSKQVADAAKLFNDGLKETVMPSLLSLGGYARLFDTAPVFNNLLDNADVFGFINVTGYNDDYANGTPSPNSQIGNNPPVSSYFWLNSLHPTWPVHNVLAHSIATFLVGA
ncbi:hypothetical protein HD553DRAFT_339329 [Filobasidium floriforme]|uniref:uncharacterized protein n=1 Tax=Filobasidium floriforme TaxID=5210 RepID=UPI001E8DC603|nr:uncharacterized protein HD553DRAFT_339329 [Filobasidium floriforme]KAH8089123.1 hypothetical protein HD553DRAFT_339329 [Filobasidium floriforme]